MNKRKALNVAVALLAGSPGVAFAATAVPATCDSTSKAVSTTYYSCVGGTHNALDISTAGGCGTWNLRGMLMGAYYYAYNSFCADSCTNTTCNNFYVVTGANGWDFRQSYVHANANSYSRTCDRCALGLVGSSHGSAGLTHADNRQYATRKTAWYSVGQVSCGASVMCGGTVGYPTL